VSLIKGAPFSMAENAGNIGGCLVCRPHHTINECTHISTYLNIKESLARNIQ
jgi:hypothetical protein